MNEFERKYNDFASDPERILSHCRTTTCLDSTITKYPPIMWCHNNSPDCSVANKANLWAQLHLLLYSWWRKVHFPLPPPWPLSTACTCRPCCAATDVKNTLATHNPRTPYHPRRHRKNNSSLNLTLTATLLSCTFVFKRKNGTPGNWRRNCFVSLLEFGFLIWPKYSQWPQCLAYDTFSDWPANAQIHRN